MPSMPRTTIPLLGLCSGLKVLALWRLPTESDVQDVNHKDTDKMLVRALQQLPHLEVCCLTLRYVADCPDSPPAAACRCEQMLRLGVELAGQRSLHQAAKPCQCCQSHLVHHVSCVWLAGAGTAVERRV